MEARRRPVPASQLLIAAPLAAVAVLAGSMVCVALLFGGSAGGCETAGGLSSAAPQRYADLYVGAATRYQLGPQGPSILAAIHKVESGFGANMGPSSAGAIGHMQFMPATWSAYGVDADRDGDSDPWSAPDAIYAAANYLSASGAPGDWRTALYAYNHSDAYVSEILAEAKRFADRGLPTAAGCGLGGSGDVVVLSGANRSGVEIQPVTMEFLRLVAGIAGVELRVGTGTNHSMYTTSGTVSDHWDGHAGDIPMSAYGKPNADPIGDRIMAACLVAGGMAPDAAESSARTGGLFTLYRGGLRIQCIWKTYAGGDHYNHVHIGARPA